MKHIEPVILGTAIFAAVILAFGLGFAAGFYPDKDRAEYLERRVSALELAADSLQRQIDFICE